LEKNNITTINKKLTQELGFATEIAWQYMKAVGITEKIWNEVNANAERAGGKYNRIKLSRVPSALIVFVANQ